MPIIKSLAGKNNGEFRTSTYIFDLCRHAYEYIKFVVSFIFRKNYAFDIPS